MLSNFPAVDAKVKEDTVFITPQVGFKVSFHIPSWRSGWNIISVCVKKRVLERLSIVMGRIGRTASVEETLGMVRL